MRPCAVHNLTGRWLADGPAIQEDLKSATFSSLFTATNKYSMSQVLLQNGGGVGFLKQNRWLGEGSGEKQFAATADTAFHAVVESLVKHHSLLSRRRACAAAGEQFSAAVA